MFEILTFTFLPNHAPDTMPSLSFFSHLDSTHFYEFLGILYMVIAILFPQWLAYSFIRTHNFEQNQEKTYEAKVHILCLLALNKTDAPHQNEAASMDLV